MKLKYIFTIIIIALLIVAFFLNWKYELIAINLFLSKEQQELKVMTWNVHCPGGTDSNRQREIAELILQADADIVLLNEYNQDSCLVLDSLLKRIYPYTEEQQSHRWSGDIFYSKLILVNSRRVLPVNGKSVQTIIATLPLGEDSVQVYGVHFMGNQYNSNLSEEGNSVMKVHNTSYTRYKEIQAYRCFQTEWIKSEVSKSKLPIIVMGDMNDFNKSKPLDILSSCGLIDSWWEGGYGYGQTFHDGILRLRIDHILHSAKLKLQSIKVIDTNLSDHNPIVAGFSVND